ncbi:hypothetical protein Tco_0138083 [Tanacetum coccineum]
MEDTLSNIMSESEKRHEENSNLIKEIQASTDASIRNQGASIKTLEIQIGQMSKEVILNGNKVLKRTVGETEQEYEPTTAEEKQDKRNEMKARGTLLMELPNKD